jgi:hypothetical protein
MYNSIALKLSTMENDKPAAWIFVILTWIGALMGSMTTRSFFRSVKALKLRGLIIMALWLPITLYESFLHWANFNQEDDESYVQVFIYLGVTACAVFFGLGLGLLFTFQGTFVGVFSGRTPGKMYGISNGFVALSMFVIHWVMRWTITNRVPSSGTGVCPKDKFDGLL